MDDNSSAASVVDPFGFRKQRVGASAPVATTAAAAKENRWSRPPTNVSGALRNSSVLKETPGMTTPRETRDIGRRNEVSSSLGLQRQRTDTFESQVYTDSSRSRRRPTLVSASSTTAASPLSTIYQAPHSTSTTRTSVQPYRLQTQPVRSTNDIDTERDGSLVPPTPQKDQSSDLMHQVCASPSNTTISQLSVSPDVTRRAAPALGTAKVRLQSRGPILARLQHHRLEPPLNSANQAVTSPAGSDAAHSTASRLQLKRLQQVQAQLDRANQDVQRLSDETAAARVQLEREAQQRMALEEQVSALAAEKEHEERQAQSGAQPQAAELAAWETALQQQAAAVDRAREQIERREQDWNELQDEMMLIEEEQHEQETRLVTWHEQLETAEQAWQTERAQLEADQERHQQELRGTSSEMASQQRRLLGTEQRLDAQALAIQERSQQLEGKEDELREWESRLQQNQQELESAAQQLDDTSKREHEKVQRMQECVKKLEEQRQAEEDGLERAVQQRQKYELETSNIKNESERAQRTLVNQIREAQAELQRGKSQVADQQRELSSLLQNKQSAMDADEARRQTVLVETAKADQNLTAVLQQLEVAQRERSAVVASLSEQRRELDSVRQHMALEEKKWHAEHAALDSKTAQIEELRSSAEQEAHDIISAAEKRVADLSHQYREQSKASSRDLESRMEELNDTVRSYERDRAVLRQKNDAHEKELQGFNKRVQDFVAVEGREKRLREELETKVKRLTALIQKERAEHTKEIQRREQSSRIQVVESEQKLSDLSQRLAVLESERDEMCTDNTTLRQGLTERDQAIELMQNDLTLARDELASTQHQVQSLQQRDSNQSFDLNQMKAFMERLEAQSSVLEQQEKQCQMLRLDFEARENDYQERVKALDQEHEQLLKKCKEQAARDQRALLLTWLGRPWRRERESVSIAFSRWIRALVAEISGGTPNAEVHEQIKDLETQVQTLGDRRDDGSLETALEALDREKSSRRELDRELRVQRKKEQELYQDIQKLSKEKERYRRESSAGLGHDKLAALEEREARIQQREDELEQMEKSIHEQERQIAEANDRIRSMASALRQKESDLDHKEARLSASNVHCSGRNDQFSFDNEE